MKETNNINRRSLLFGHLKSSSSVQESSANISDQKSIRIIPIHRPPGAINESEFLEQCTRCFDCADVCPHDAIVSAPNRFQNAKGTPMINLHIAPCHMCVDTPCIAACGTGALSPHQPQKMGSARIQPHNCLAFANTFCSVCIEQCPVSDAIKQIDNKPYIQDKTCTGCGVCAFACPAPVKAIMVLPLPDRP